jgi:hypothetical protein
VWSGTHQRGAQLHELRDAVLVWGTRYGQQAWLRQLEPAGTRQMEDAALRTVARLDGTPFPTTSRLVSRWVRGRVPARASGTGSGTGSGSADLETAYCAEVVAVTYQAMGLLPAGRRPNWYDPGRFWSGDELGLAGAGLGGEISVQLPTDTPMPRPADGARRRRARVRRR